MLKLDHIVVKVKALEAAIARYEAEGFTVTRGGEHPAFGSVNALIPFEDDSYIELIAFPGVMHPDATLTAPGRRVAQWREKPYGPIDWALVPDDIEAEIARLRAAGQVWDDPVPGQRVRTDGQVVKWWFGTPDTFMLPFLCADITARELRVPTGAARQHRNRVTGIYEIEVYTRDMETMEQQYGILFEQPPVLVSADGHTAIDRNSWQLRLTPILERDKANEGLFDVIPRGWDKWSIPMLEEEEEERKSREA